MENILTIVFLGILICILIGILKKYAPAYVLPTAICFGIIMTLFFLPEIESLKELFSLDFGIESEWLKTLIKIVLICFIGQWGSSICLDAGEKFVAERLETAVKITVVTLCVPYIKELFEIVKTLE